MSFCPLFFRFSILCDMVWWVSFSFVYFKFLLVLASKILEEIPQQTQHIHTFLYNAHNDNHTPNDPYSHSTLLPKHNSHVYNNSLPVSHSICKRPVLDRPSVCNSPFSSPFSRKPIFHDARFQLYHAQHF